MARDSDRARRISARRKVKAAIESLRAASRALAEWERLEDADAIGVVSIRPSTSEAEYGADVLDIVSHAVSEAGDNQVVEVFITTSSTDTSIGQQPIGEQSCQEGSTPTRGRKSARKARS